MSFLNLENDEINKAMVDGLKQALRKELKEELMKVAEEEIDQIINKLCERIHIKSKCFEDTPFSERLKNKFFHLEWIISKDI